MSDCGWAACIQFLRVGVCFLAPATVRQQIPVSGRNDRVSSGIRPFYASASITSTGFDGKKHDLGSLSGFGGELGYRFYTGKTGPTGFFVGPSALFAAYTSQSVAIPGLAGSGGSSSFTSIGGAVDIGGQAVIGPGVVIAGGAGLQYTSTSQELNTKDFNFASAAIAGGGFRPRFLLAVGYAF